MRKYLYLLPGVLALAGAALMAGSRPAAAQTGQWRPLFNGVDMNGWTSMNQGNWTVQNDYLTYTGGGNGWLRTNQEFRNFSLVATWRYTQPGNNDSGLFVRAGAEGNPWPGQGYQLNMGPGNNYGSLGGAQNAPAKPELIKPQGQWNTYQLTVVDDQASLAINNQPAWDDARGLTRPSGYIGFQAENRPIEIAQVWIMELGPGGAGAAAGLNQPPPGFSALFNGRDLTNWQGLIEIKERATLSGNALRERQARADALARQHWSVEDGILVFDGKGQSLQTAKDYGNFEMYVDWKILKAGDSGIYLRGNPQVQIWDNPVGSGGLFNNKNNRSTPLVAADRPVGEWNTFYIKMIGDRVTIRLNDQLVVDNTPLENYWFPGQPLPARGPIELQNHGNVLEFRNIYIRELPDNAR